MVSCTCPTCGLSYAAPGNCCDVVCGRCGNGKHPPRDPIANPCLHLIGFTGENIEAKDCGCQTAKPMTATAECELHGLCTVIQPAANESMHCCQTCPDYSHSNVSSTKEVAPADT